MGQNRETPSLLRCLLVLVVVTAGSAALVSWLLRDLVAVGEILCSGPVGDQRFDEVLVGICELTTAGCAMWLWLATAVVTGDAARGRTPGHRGVPAVLHRTVLAACGAALVGGLGGPAHAEETRRGHETRPALVRGLPLPDRATTATHVSRVFAQAASPRERPAGQEPAVVVVRPGDTLWQLARADLARAGPAPATDVRAVVERVREIYDANRAVIGPDPDVIRPGQRLRMPQPNTRPTTIREEPR
jgi:LysM domain